MQHQVGLPSFLAGLKGSVHAVCELESAHCHKNLLPSGGPALGKFWGMKLFCTRECLGQGLED